MKKFKFYLKAHLVYILINKLERKTKKLKKLINQRVEILKNMQDDDIVNQQLIMIYLWECGAFLHPMHYVGDITRKIHKTEIKIEKIEKHLKKLENWKI